MNRVKKSINKMLAMSFVYEKEMHIYTLQSSGIHVREVGLIYH